MNLVDAVTHECMPKISLEIKSYFQFIFSYLLEIVYYMEIVDRENKEAQTCTYLLLSHMSLKCGRENGMETFLRKME
jgi:hypothetical protein